MAELLVLDPAEVAAAGRVAFDITKLVGPDGPDYGQAEIDAQMAEAQLGQIPVDFRVPPRIVTIPLILRRLPGLTYDQARTRIQAKAARFQREGGWLKRASPIGTVYADVVSATLKMGGSSYQAMDDGVDPDAVLTLECVPDWYGDEVALTNWSETTLPALVKVEDGPHAGDMPGRLRIVVTEAQGQAQRGLLWGIRSRHYDPAATAKLQYEAEALTPLGAAAVATVAGASGGASNNAVTHPSLAKSWTPVLSTQILSGGAQMTHRGSYRVWARVRTTSFPTPRVRLVWDVGDFTSPSENARQWPTFNEWYWLDLGEIRLDASPVGPHRWQGVIQAIGGIGGENISIDAVLFQPFDDGAGRLSTPILIPDNPANVNGFDAFTATTAGNALNARTAPLGGAWATSGDATDFVFTDAVGEAISRATTADASTGRDAVLGTTDYTNVAWSFRFRLSSVAGLTWWIQPIIRRVSATQFLRLSIAPGLAANDPPRLILELVDISSNTVIASVNDYPPFEAGIWYTVTVAAYSSGHAVARIQGPRTAIFAGFNTKLATGGTHATGKPGLRDFGGVGAATRYYSDFTITTPPELDAVVNANQSIELRTDGMFREDSAGAAYGHIVPDSGSLPRLPPSGLEGRKVELFLKASRGDFAQSPKTGFAQLPDTGIDDISAQMFYRPSWLYVADGAPGS